MKGHKAIQTSLKTFDVDCLIKPVVDWLNSYDDVYTQYSCQGTVCIVAKQKEDVQWSPYVLFWCLDYDTLRRILKKIDTFSRIPKTIGRSHNVMGGVRSDIDWVSDMSPLNYTIRFYDRKILKEFVAYLQVM